MSEHPMSKPWLDWRPIGEHPVWNRDDIPLGEGPPLVFVYSSNFGGKYHFGHVYNYGGGTIRARAEGFHGDWKITHYAECPDGPTE
jgi:hypothetical protein